MAKSIEVDGEILYIGDEISFKEDYERYGEIVGISGKYIDIEYEVSEGYISVTTKHVDHCWVE